MRKIVRLDVPSVIAACAVFYALLGLYSASKSVLAGAESLTCPFGFAFPFTTLFVTITLHLPHPATWLTAVLIVITSVFYGLTGVMSGLVVAYGYNFTSRFWPGIFAVVDKKPRVVRSGPAPPPEIAVQDSDEAVTVQDSHQNV